MSAWSLSGGLLLAFLTPTMAGALGAEGHARMGPVLFALAVLVVAAKMGGLLCALAGKLACALGVVRRGMNRLAVAFGMVPRGEVGLIFAGIGTSLTLQGGPLLSQSIFSAVVLMVLVTNARRAGRAAVGGRLLRR